MNTARRNALIVKIILFITFGILGSAFAFGAPAILRALTSGYTEEVSALITDCTAHDDDGTTMYSAVYEFEYDGKTYTVTSSTSTSWEPKIGDTVELKINPDDPNKTYEPKVGNIIVRIFCIVGCVFIAIGVIALLIPFHKWA